MAKQPLDPANYGAYLNLVSDPNYPAAKANLLLLDDGFRAFWLENRTGPDLSLVKNPALPSPVDDAALTQNPATPLTGEA